MRALAATTLIAVLSSGCGWGDSPVVVVRPSPTPTVLAGPTVGTEATGTEPNESPAGATSVTAWFAVGSERGLFVAPETHDLAEPTVGVARAALTEVVEGVTRNPAHETLAPVETAVLGVDRDDEVVTLDLSAAVVQTGRSSGEEIAFAQQLAHTATQFEGVTGVRLLVEGEPVDELWGHLDWSEPIEPDPDAVAPVVIVEPGYGDIVAAGTVTASGTANVFEATVVLTLVGPDGEVAEETFTTATCGSGCRGTWEHTFEGVESPGQWTLRAGEEDASDGEGFAPHVAEVVFEVG